MSRPNIVVVGSSNTDLVLATGNLPAPGETVMGDEFLMAAGGKGANQAVAAARLGADVTLVARLGTDVFGDQAVAGFEAEGIRTDFVVRDAERASGVALILVGDDGENLIGVGPGANSALSEADVDAAGDAIAEADLLLLQLEVPMAAVRRAAKLAARAGTGVMLDPAPAAELAPRLLARVAYLTPNEIEAELLTGVAVTDEPSARRASKMLRDRGPANVLITLGAAGCLVRTDSGARTIAGNRVEAVDSTAAGDTFNGALAVALASGRSLEQAVAFAHAAAAVSVTRRGAQMSMPVLAEL